MRPNVYIIAGPNGAGKTTFAREFLPHYADCKNFINADLIAQGVSPFSPDAAAFRAGKLMLSEIAQYSKRRVDLGFETTLSGHSHLKLIRSLMEVGYRPHIFFLWLPKVDLALDRVRARVFEGGHDVPESVVRRRYERSIRNFPGEYRFLAESWTLLDNSGETPKTAASCAKGAFSIIKGDMFRDLIACYGEK